MTFSEIQDERLKRATEDIFNRNVFGARYYLLLVAAEIDSLFPVLASRLVDLGASVENGLDTWLSHPERDVKFVKPLIAIRKELLEELGAVDML